MWCKLRIITLQGQGMTEVWAEVWDVGATARVADKSNNAYPVRQQPHRAWSAAYAHHLPYSGLYVFQERLAMWRKLGIISLRGQGVTTVLADVWDVGGAARVADLGNNTLASLAPAISCLVNLQRLRLNHNQLSEGSIPWEALATLSGLTMLALDHNR